LTKPVVAISYGVASNGGYSVKDDGNYIKPEMVTQLPDANKIPEAGPQEAADEVSGIILFLVTLSNQLL
jgi:hypothetical protein